VAARTLLRRISALASDPRAPMLVMVTHHVEEVPAGFTHAMLLRRGGVLAAGPLERVFTERKPLPVLRHPAAQSPDRAVAGRPPLSTRANAAARHAGASPTIMIMRGPRWA